MKQTPKTNPPVQDNKPMNTKEIVEKIGQATPAYVKNVSPKIGLLTQNAQNAMSEVESLAEEEGLTGGDGLLTEQGTRLLLYIAQNNRDMFDEVLKVLERNDWSLDFGTESSDDADDEQIPPNEMAMEFAKGAIAIENLREQEEELMSQLGDHDDSTVTKKGHLRKEAASILTKLLLVAQKQRDIFEIMVGLAVKAGVEVVRDTRKEEPQIPFLRHVPCGEA